MRVGLITGEYPPDQGGVGDYTLQLARALAEAGHQVHVVTGARGSTQREPAGPAVSVHRLVPYWGWRCWRDVLRWDRVLGCDILNVQYQTAAYQMHPAINLLPWRIRRHGGPPVVVTFHDLRVPYLFPKAGPLRGQAVLALARWASGVIVTTREDEAVLAGSGLWLEHRVRIPIGSNIAPHVPDGYDRDVWRRGWGVGPDDLLLGYFGFLNERKGGEDLIETLACLVARGINAHLLLVGGRVGSSDPTNAAYAQRVDGLIKRHGLASRVHRTGFVTPGEVSACLTAVDICLLPYREGASLRHGSLHACLAHGRPIVTTEPSADDPDLQDGVHVLLVPARDTAALAEAVERVWHDAALSARLAAGAYALAREFAWDRIGARTADFFAEVLS